MRFVQIDTLPSGKALVDIDKLTHAVPEGEGSRLFLVRSTSTCRIRLPSWKTCSPGVIDSTMAGIAGPGSGSGKLSF